MRQATSLGFKLVAYAAIFGVTLPVFGGLSFGRAMILAAVHTLILWLVDLTVLPRFGSVNTTIADAIILVGGTPVVLGAMFAYAHPIGLLLAYLVGVAFEWWFHGWLFATDSLQ